MRQLEQAIRRFVADMLTRIGSPFWGTVAAVSPDGMSIRVKREPEGTLTGWLPVVRQAGGSGAMGAIPVAGWTCYVVPDRDQSEHGVVTGFAHNSAAPLPQVPDTAGTLGVRNGTPVAWRPGEAFLINEAGTVIRLAGGKAFISGDVEIDGDLRVNGEIEDRYGKLNDFRTAYNSHTHPDPQGGNTSPPDPQVPA